MKAYINYPNPHFTVHWNDACPQVQKHQREGQRVVLITSQSIETALSPFIAKEVTFSAKAGQNDMWLDIALPSPKHEEAIVFVIQAILGNRYAPLAEASIETHTCPPLLA